MGAQLVRRLVFFVWFFFSFFVLLTVFWLPQVWKASIWPQMVQIGGTITTGLDFFCCACPLFLSDVSLWQMDNAVAVDEWYGITCLSSSIVAIELVCGWL